jgi:tRNA A37 threonylcarbamoyladenosine modification protein TsaB
MPSLVEIAKEISVEPREIELIVVSIGPGGFTGLRTAVSIAKMMSLSTGATIVPVETAEVIVSSSAQTDGLFIVVSGVKDDTFWLSKVYCDNNELKCESQLSSTDLFADQLDGVVGVFADIYFPKPVNELCNDYNVPIHQSCCDAVSLLKLGLKYHCEGINIDPKMLLPLYPREPEAVRLWKLKRHSS